MQIVEIKTTSQIRAFHELPLRIYCNDPSWIQPLQQDIEAVFNRKMNKNFRQGDAVRWLLTNDSGETTGRVAAFFNEKISGRNKQPTGGIGFFECVNDKIAAFRLFDECKKWLAARGMEAMDGPINFGERDRWWGLLAEGFTEPNYCTNYNPPYYREFFEEYGFKTYYEQFTYRMTVSDQLPEKTYEKAKRVALDPGYSFENIDKRNLDKYAEHFRIIYNKAWVKHAGVGEITKPQARALMNSIKPILDPDIIWFGYYHKEPIAFFIMIPELNQIFKYCNGKLNLIGKMKFLWHRWSGTCRKMFGLVFGVVPEHQGKGVEGAIVIASARRVQPKARYDIFEMNWIGDFNPKMMHLSESLGAKVVKKHITFRKLFNNNALFERMSVIE